MSSELTDQFRQVESLLEDVAESLGQCWTCPEEQVSLLLLEIGQVLDRAGRLIRTLGRVYSWDHRMWDTRLKKVDLIHQALNLEASTIQRFRNTPSRFDRQVLE